MHAWHVSQFSISMQEPASLPYPELNTDFFLSPLLRRLAFLAAVACCAFWVAATHHHHYGTIRRGKLIPTWDSPNAIAGILQALAASPACLDLSLLLMTSVQPSSPPISHTDTLGAGGRVRKALQLNCDTLCTANDWV
jgi:hypothetical protein